MIIKRNLKSVMPSMKRCRVSDSGGEDDESSGNRKKRKPNNGFYPLHLLPEVGAGVIPFSGYGIQRILAQGSLAASTAVATTAVSWCTGVSYCPGEAESKLKGKESGSRIVQEPPRPPLVRTSRGRVQVLPSRFNDSVLDNWKKEKSKISVKEEDSDPEFNPYKDKCNLKSSKLRGEMANIKHNEDNYRCRKVPSLLEDGRGELGSQRLKSFSFRKYSSSRSTLTSLNEQFADVEEYEELEEEIDLSGIDESSKGDVKKKGLIYGPNDFVSGDIVWAISGKHCPAWPAIVLDPETQTPPQVLNFRISGAVCVMFFGYSGNGTQRVSLFFLSYMPYLDGMPKLWCLALLTVFRF